MAIKEGVSPLSKLSTKLSKKSTLGKATKPVKSAEKKKPAKVAAQPVLPAVLPAVLPEVTDLYERAAWKKEKKEYWMNQFRKILAAAPPVKTKTQK